MDETAEIEQTALPHTAREYAELAEAKIAEAEEEQPARHLAAAQAYALLAIAATNGEQAVVTVINND